jgi:hypothetical protein
MTLSSLHFLSIDFLLLTLPRLHSQNLTGYSQVGNSL